jgi:hypothetical protein
MRYGDVFKKIMAHHRSQNDANYHVPQYVRIEASLLHTPFVFRLHHASTNAAPNANGTI